MMMKYRATKLFGLFALIVAASAVMMTSCTEAAKTDDSTIEKEIFEEWMAKHHPDLIPNYQQDGEYYIDLISAGNTSGNPIKDTVCYVEYDMTGYDLYGNVTITRNGVTAWQQGTFKMQTHYGPYYRVSDPKFDQKEDFKSVLECSQLAFSRTLTIGDEQVDLYNGAEFILYSPSSLISGDGVNGTGGYDGQYTLGTLPFVCKIKVTNVVINPLKHDEELVNAFATANGGVTITPESLNNNYDPDNYDKEDNLKPNAGANAWVNATNYVPYVYINPEYSLNMFGASFNYINPYTSKVPESPYYNGVEALDLKVNEALEKRFSSEYTNDGKEVDWDGDAKIWYICRTLDGFIVDTNIAQVKELIYDEEDASGSAIGYNAEDDEKSYIYAWYYSIPHMRHGKWNAIVTSSSYAYGSTGVSGGTSSSSSGGSSYNPYYDYYNYYGGYNNYYGNSYYNNYYGGGMGYYNNYYSSGTGSTTTTTTVSTEILPYAPLIFQMFVEADQDAETEEE